MLTMSRKRRSIAICAALVVVIGAIAANGLFFAQHTLAAKLNAPRLIRLSTDPYTNFGTQHQTQVEPHILSFGTTLVATFQSGRGYTAGSSNIGWATSHDRGKTWQHGFLPDLTVNVNGPYARASDSVVAYDAKHHVWLISVLAVPFSGGFDVLVSRSTDGGLTWSNPIPVARSGANDNLDKDWMVCDTHASSPFYGHCYAQWDNAAQGGKIGMSTSTDGGLTWSAPNGPATQSMAAIGGQPLVQPNGKVIVPIFGADDITGAGGIYAYTSSDGGATWTTPILVASANGHFQTASYRGGILPSAAIDSTGKVYVVWSDCSFEDSCLADDIVLVTSTDGTTWSPVTRIPIDAVGSNVDHFTPGLAVNPATGGTTAHLALVYYYFPNTRCFTFNCQLDVGLVSSTNGGSTWSNAQQIDGPIQLPWLADTSSGFMTGDYIAATIVNDDIFPVFASASAPSSGHLNEAIFTTADADLRVTGGTNSGKNDHRVASATPAPTHKTQPVATAN